MLLDHPLSTVTTLPDLATWSSESDRDLTITSQDRWIRGETFGIVGESLISFNPGRKVAPEFDGISHLCQTIFDQICLGNHPQNVSLEGESGSGKTTIFERLIPALVARFDTSPELEFKINPAMKAYLELIDAMGTAGTPNNASSSRYGKRLEICLDSTSRKIIAFKLKVMMLERSRIAHSHKSPKQTNFLIFRYLLADPSRFPSLHLEDEFNLVPNATLDKTPAFKAKASAFFAVLENLELDIDSFAAYLAGLLHMGNYTGGFEDKALSKVAKCWKVDEARVKEDLTCKRIGQEKLPRAESDVRAVRDSAISVGHSTLFQYLTTHFNEYFGGGLCTDDCMIVGVGDVAGIEDFGEDVNSINQILYSLLHEALRFRGQTSAHSLYSDELLHEGLDVDDQPPPVRTAGYDITQKLVGIVTDISRTVVSGSIKPTHQERMLNNIDTMLSGPEKAFLDRSNQLLTIPHEARSITYNLRDLIVDNMLGSPQTLVDIFVDSKNSIIHSLLPSLAKTPVGPISAIVNSEIADMINTISRGTTRSVFCIKPFRAIGEQDGWNESVWDEEYVGKQIRCAGISHLLRLLAGGWKERMTIDNFLKCFPVEKSEESDAVMVEAWLSGVLAPSDYYVGETKVFVRAGCMKELEMERIPAPGIPSLDNDFLPALPDEDDDDLRCHGTDPDFSEDYIDQLHSQLDEKRLAALALQQQLESVQRSLASAIVEKETLSNTLRKVQTEREIELAAREREDNDIEIIRSENTQLRKQMQKHGSGAKEERLILERERDEARGSLIELEACLKAEIEGRERALSRVELATSNRQKDQNKAREDKVKMLCGMIAHMSAPTATFSIKPRDLFCTTVAAEIRNHILETLRAAPEDKKVEHSQMMEKALSAMCQTASRNKMLVWLICREIRQKNPAQDTAIFRDLGSKCLEAYSDEVIKGLYKSGQRHALYHYKVEKAIKIFLTDLRDCQAESKDQNSILEKVVENLRPHLSTNPQGAGLLTTKTLEEMLGNIAKEFPGVKYLPKAAVAVPSVVEPVRHKRNAKLTPHQTRSA